MPGAMLGARDSKVYSVVSAFQRYRIRKEKEAHKQILAILCGK